MTKVKKSEDKVHLELTNLKAMLARALADYDNLSKRVEREREVLGKMSSVGILAKLMPVLDNLEAAQVHLKDAGLAICIGEFKKVLSEEGLNEIAPSIGDEFNENTMEAIEVTTGERDNVISELILTGWKFNDGQVIRHAKVKVSKISN
jgi:molecular chaperone GrpE